MSDGRVRALLKPLLEGPLPAGWRLVSWDVEQGISVTLQHGARCVLVEFEPRDDGRPCYARTLRFNACARLTHAPREPLTEGEHRLVGRVIELVRRGEHRLPVVQRPADTRASAVREITVDRALVAEGDGNYYFNPYVGCMIGCAFCYVADRADLSRALQGLPGLPWGRYVDVKVNAAEVLRREVATVPPGIVRLSPILTDPYQPLERRYRITRQALEVFLEAGFTPVILTRAARVVDDIDLLRRFPVAAVGLSIPTDDDRVREVFEPRADPIEARLEALARCHAAGLRTFVVVQPVLPMDVDHLVARVAPHVRAVRIDRMHQAERSRGLYETAGVPHAMDDGFFTRTEQALRDGFARHGVPIDTRDDLGGLVGRG